MLGGAMTVSRRLPLASLALCLFVVVMVVAQLWPCTAMEEAEDDPDDYLWAFTPNHGGVEDRVKLTIPDKAKEWFHYLVNAQAFIDRGRLEDAAANYDQVLTKFQLPQNEEQRVHMALGRVLVDMSLLEEARRSFLFAASIRHNQHIAHYWLGVVAAKRGLFDEAKDALQNALFYNPSYFPAMLNLGGLLIVQGYLEQGLYYYKAALERLEPEDVDEEAKSIPLERVLPRMVHHVLQAFAGESDTEPAEVAAALKLFMQHSHNLDLGLWHLNLGFALLNVGAHDEGIAHLERTVAYQEDETWLHANILLSIPIVHDSADAVRESRSQLHHAVATALFDGFSFANPERFRDMYHTTYMLPYTGFPNRALMTDISRLLARSRPPAGTVAPHLAAHYGLKRRSGGSSFSSLTLAPQWDWEAADVAAWSQGETAHGGSSGSGGSGGSGSSGSSTGHARRTSGTVRSKGGGRRARGKAARGRRRSSSDGAGDSAGDRDGGALGFSKPSPVRVRVGILSYQLHDHPVGHLAVALTQYLALPHAKRTLLQRQRGEQADSTTTKGTAASGSLGRRGRSVGRGRSVSRSRKRLEEGSAGTGEAGGDSSNDTSSSSSSGKADMDVAQLAALYEDGVLDLIPKAKHKRPVEFKVTVLLPRPYGDDITQELLSHAHRLIKLPQPRDLEQWKQSISFEQLDVLIVFHDGTDSYIQTLLQSRIAPVQILYWGTGGSHVLTSGMPNTVDYLVAGDDVAIPSAQEDFAEQLVRLGKLGVFYSPPPPPSEKARHSVVSTLSLFADRRLYLCPVVLAHLHPDFDDVVAAIIANDKDGEVLLLYEPDQELWLEKARRRLYHHPLVARDARRFRRVRFAALPDSREKLLALMLSCEVVLDPFPVGTDIPTGYDVLFLAQPIVTMPHAQGPRPLMSVTLDKLHLGAASDAGLVVDSVEAYVSAAVRIAGHDRARLALRRRIKAAFSTLSWALPGDSAGGDGDRDSITSRLNAAAAEAAGGSVAAAGTDGANRRLSRSAGDALATHEEGVAAVADWEAFLVRVSRPWALQAEAVANSSGRRGGSKGSSGSGSSSRQGGRRHGSRRAVT